MSAKLAAVQIRVATADDIHAILALWEVAAAEPSVSDDPEGLAALLERDPEALLVAVDGTGVIVGTLIAGWDGWRAGLYRLAVHPDRRRQGIATALVAKGEARLRALGTRKIQGIVLTENATGREFWESLGYAYDATTVRHTRVLP